MYIASLTQARHTFHFPLHDSTMCLLPLAALYHTLDQAMDSPLMHFGGPPCSAGSQQVATSGNVIRSKYRGLSWDKKHQGWRVRLYFAGKQRHVGKL